MIIDDADRAKAERIVADAERLEREERRAERDRRRSQLGGRRFDDGRDPLMVHVASKIVGEMNRRRMTVRGLAIRAGLDDRTVRRVLDAHNTGLSNLAAIANALQLPLTSVFVFDVAESAAEVSESSG